MIAEAKTPQEYLLESKIKKAELEQDKMLGPVDQQLNEQLKLREELSEDQERKSSKVSLNRKQPSKCGNKHKFIRMMMEH